MFIAQVKNLADDFEKNHRWALANLTDDDANDTVREKLTRVRIVGIGPDEVQGMLGGGETRQIDPARIQRVW